MDSQKQQPQGQLESSFYDFLTDLNGVLKKHGIDDPILDEELDKLKTSEISETSLYGLNELGRRYGLGRRLKCTIEWGDGGLQFKCTRDI